MLRVKYLLLALTFASTAHAEALQKYAPESPTRASTSLNDELTPATEDLSHSLSRQPGVYVIDQGGAGKQKSLQVRGAKAADIDVTLEGVRLNSPSLGEFDFSSLLPFGLEDATLIRGSYSPQSANSQAQLKFRLPSKEIIRTTVSGGTPGAWAIAQQVPHAVVAFDRNPNDYRYYDETTNTLRVREQNASSRLNARTWKRWKDYQVWAQLLYANLELPGSVIFPSLGSTSTTWTPMAAFQGQIKSNWDFSTWYIFQHQTYRNPNFVSKSSNLFSSGGIRSTLGHAVTENSRLNHTIEWSLDKLNSTQHQLTGDSSFGSPFRHTVSYSASYLWDVTDSWLLNPYVRGEFVSDMDQPFSAHPGIGARWVATEDLEVRAHVAYTSRVPTFYELHFAEPPFILSNPNLTRQQSLQADAGYAWTLQKSENSWVLEQILFGDRTFDLLQSVNTAGVFQVQNVGTRITMGVENVLHYRRGTWFDLAAGYTHQYSTLNDRMPAYQPAHLVSLKPTLMSGKLWSFALPLRFRSAMRGSSGKSMREQFDLQIQMTGQVKNIQLGIQITNVLGWRREETEGYPLSHEPDVTVSASANF